MGIGCFNLKDKKFKYFHEKNEATKYDLSMREIEKKIVLISMNDIKTFSGMDVSRKNEKTIQSLIKDGGFSPMNEDMADSIAQQYMFCPDCGEDIDFSKPTSIVIWDSGISLRNVATDNLYLAKPLTCEKCGKEHLYYLDMFASDEDKKKHMKATARAGSHIYLKLRYIIDNEKKSYIPIMIYFKQFMAFFDEKEKKEKGMFLEDEEKNKPDIKKTLAEKSDKEILRMLFNERVQEVLETPDNKLVGNLKVEFKPIVIGAYSKYVTRKDFEKIEMYQSIGDSTEKLKSLVLE